jgi:hypothetical protein
MMGGMELLGWIYFNDATCQLRPLPRCASDCRPRADAVKRTVAERSKAVADPYSMPPAPSAGYHPVQ